MTLARVSITARPGELPQVLVDGTPLPAVSRVQVTATPDGIPQVAVVFSAGQVDVDGEAAVSVVRAGPSMVAFAEQLDARRLERDALEADEDLPQGQAFKEAVRAQAADFDGRR
jgi:hypothetical protein